MGSVPKFEKASTVNRRTNISLPVYSTIVGGLREHWIQPEAPGFMQTELTKHFTLKNPTTLQRYQCN